MKKIILLILLFITSCNITKPQSFNHPYLLFSGDTAIKGINKTCICFNDFQFLMKELEKSKDDTNEYAQIFKKEMLSKYKSYSVSEMINDLSHKYMLIDTTLDAFKRGDQNKDSNIIEVLEIVGLNITLYYDLNHYLELTIFVDHKDMDRIPLNDVDSSKILKCLFKKDKFCAYIFCNEINKEIIAYKKTYESTNYHPGIGEEIRRLEKLREKMNKIYEEKKKINK